MPQNIIPAEAVIRLNMPVLAFTLSVGSADGAGVWAGAGAEKRREKDLNEPLRDSGKGISGGFRHGRLRDAVVVLEVGLSLTLLVAAGLLMRSFVALRDVKLGLQTRSYFRGRDFRCQWNGTRRRTQVTGILPAAVAAAERRCRGVVEATENEYACRRMEGFRATIEVPGKTHAEKMEGDVSAGQRGIFSSAQDSIRGWQGFHGSGSEWSAARLAIVNQTFVKKYLGNENPIGRQVRIAQLAEFDDAVERTGV